MEYRKVIKVGGSFAITIPSGMLKYMGVEKGEYVQVTATEYHQIIIQKLKPERGRSFFVPGLGKLRKWHAK